jgi:hypothetical protein
MQDDERLALYTEIAADAILRVQQAADFNQAEAQYGLSVVLHRLQGELGLSIVGRNLREKFDREQEL